jgi:hypothetical protein
MLALKGPFGHKVPKSSLPLAPLRDDLGTEPAPLLWRPRLRLVLCLLAVLWLAAALLLMRHSQWWQQCVLWLLGILDAKQAANCSRCAVDVFRYK